VSQSGHDLNASATPVFREAGAKDTEHIRWALYTALAWNPERELSPPEITLERPEAARYHRGWGRPGDFGVLATVHDEVVGVAYCRLFTEDDHGYGFVDVRTPEVALAVREGHRGRGLGGSLLERLAELARAAGFTRLSLSVEETNPARRLYARVGYREIAADDQGGVRMLVELE
jgi:GNAT superfamily N-acetyltransferase